ncbi:hypothetical protein C3747_130g7 [Trypanosoma cruzi]|uniref:Cation transporter n=2 Tax=Trypanosoma cruzi TaxID=5693 RepID=Q4CNS4_TRYCC|nr:hypothetical protein Tc00.1047053510227.20 [Trypanosoma cruzi]EAN81926.1 hypothetical protein Tc00.1047053510227.20 [Trypanosoma cruzi]PWV05456.1 hypothetical protein C3747_130g7 [Trypanosoma cruzi]|eukprot:XP_803382.1 hypothetical protein [Trypanosoma cruzi strain CL Brener]
MYYSRRYGVLLPSSLPRWLPHTTFCFATPFFLSLSLSFGVSTLGWWLGGNRARYERRGSRWCHYSFIRQYMIPPQLHFWCCSSLMRRLYGIHAASLPAYCVFTGQMCEKRHKKTDCTMGRGKNAAGVDDMAGDSCKEKPVPGDRQPMMGIGENVRSDVYSSLITFTEVSTGKGVRWLDVAGRTHSWAHDSFVEEGEFVAHAMVALRRGELPPDMILKVSHNVRPLPFVYVEESWACLTLRCARQNPFWFSMILPEKVKEFSAPALDDIRRSKYSKLQESGEDEDDTLDFSDADDDQVRRYQGKTLGKKKNVRRRMSSQVTITESTDRLHIFLLKESQKSNEKSDKPNRFHLGPQEAEKLPHKGGGDTKLNPCAEQCWIVTVHRHRLPFLEELLNQWVRSRRHGDTWIGLLRRIVRGATMSVQTLDHKDAERLDELETVLFGSATKLNELSKILTQLHIINRRSKIHANLLRETQRCYMKLLTALSLPVQIEDQRELVYLSTVSSLADELHDQSRSLLALQFSVAVYVLEDHLRILTLFTTFFIPLELITSWFGTNFVGLKDFMEDPWGLFIAGAMLVVTAIITNVWMRRPAVSLP